MKSYQTTSLSSKILSVGDFSYLYDVIFSTGGNEVTQKSVCKIKEKNTGRKATREKLKIDVTS